MTDKVTVYDVDIDKELFDSVKDKIKKIDPSQNYSKKHTIKQAVKLTDYLLNEKYDSHAKDVDRIKRELNDIEDVLK